MKTVFLCGFMGCGKTTVGKLFADRAGSIFVDMDAYIEDYEHRIIADIFASDGEAHFRKLEREATERLAPSGYVVATGGGCMVDPANAETAKKDGGCVVFIDTPFESCYARISGDKRRPLAASASREELLARFEARRGAYLSAADHIVDGSGTPKEICERIAGCTGFENKE
ncbi:MAG: shikimate kinase [Ruminococcus sp.]|nr:shikimate kinase [Ruminococcus sp.]